MGNIHQCTAPWNEMLIAFTQLVLPCCYFRGPNKAWDDTADADVFTYWNSPEIQKARETIVTGRIDGTGGCYQCPMLTWTSDSEMVYHREFMKVSDKFGPLVQENWLRAIENYQSGRIVVDASPLRFFILFSYRCNIKCRMCTQENYRLLGEHRRSLTCDSLLRFAPYFSRAKHLDVMGGEPFCEPEALKFIKYVVANEKTLSYQYLGLFSNASLLHHHLDMLAAKKRIWLTVSLDGVGEAYEFIRAGGKWDRIESNMLRFKERGLRLGHEWIVNTVHLLTKETVRNLVPLAEWHAANAIDTAFNDFCFFSANYAFFKRQGVLANSRLLDDIPDWRQRFEEAVAILKAAHNPGGDSLERLYHTLRDGSSSKDYTAEFFAFRDRFDDFLETMQGKIEAYLAGREGKPARIAVFGAAPAGLALADYVNRAGGKFTGFFDNNTANPNRKNVFAPEKLKTAKCDAIVVASLSHAREITQQIRCLVGDRPLDVLSL